MEISPAGACPAVIRSVEKKGSAPHRLTATRPRDPPLAFSSSRSDPSRTWAFPNQPFPNRPLPKPDSRTTPFRSQLPEASFPKPVSPLRATCG